MVRLHQRRLMAFAIAVLAAVAGTALLAPTAASAHLPYPDPSLSSPGNS